MASQRILDFGDNSIFIDADPGEPSSNSIWLRIGRIETDESQQARLTATQARTLAYALLVHAEGLEDREKQRSAAPVEAEDRISSVPFERAAVARHLSMMAEFPFSRRRYRSHEG